ncbi:MAG: SixA phosphatase family protein [Phycisphaerales bacterium]
MRLIIIRHGKAERDAASGREHDRALTSVGHAQAEFLGQALKDAGLLPARLLHSPLVRAEQTAREISRGCGCTREVCDDLALDEPLGPVLERIHLARGTDTGVLALVGHNPRLEQLGALLCADLRGSGFRLRTGQSVVIDFTATAALDEGRLAETLRLPDGDE